MSKNTPLSIGRVAGMKNDLNTILDRIKETAVGRCRERIEFAADKAREVLNKKKKEEPNDYPPKVEREGVSSLMKRQHGL
jgi:hypothetical protein